MAIYTANLDAHRFTLRKECLRELNERGLIHETYRQYLGHLCVTFVHENHEAAFFDELKHLHGYLEAQIITSIRPTEFPVSLDFKKKVTRVSIKPELANGRSIKAGSIIQIVVRNFGFEVWDPAVWKQTVCFFQPVP